MDNEKRLKECLERMRIRLSLAEQREKASRIREARFEALYEDILNKPPPKPAPRIIKELENKIITLENTIGDQSKVILSLHKKLSNLNKRVW